MNNKKEGINFLSNHSFVFGTDVYWHRLRVIRSRMERELLRARHEAPPIPYR